jgi:hypothetical protein
MLLTLTTTHKPATDLGYLLHKNPAKLHSFELSFGKAHVFYPEATAERCTAALLLDVDPVGLVRGSRRHHGLPLSYRRPLSSFRFLPRLALTLESARSGCILLVPSAGVFVCNLLMKTQLSDAGKFALRMSAT